MAFGTYRNAKSKTALVGISAPSAYRHPIGIGLGLGAWGVAVGPFRFFLPCRARASSLLSAIQIIAHTRAACRLSQRAQGALIGHTHALQQAPMTDVGLAATHIAERATLGILERTSHAPRSYSPETDDYRVLRNLRHSSALPPTLSLPNNPTPHPESPHVARGSPAGRHRPLSPHEGAACMRWRRVRGALQPRHRGGNRLGRAPASCAWSTWRGSLRAGRGRRRP